MTAKPTLKRKKKSVTTTQIVYSSSVQIIQKHDDLIKDYNLVSLTAPFSSKKYCRFE